MELVDIMRKRSIKKNLITYQKIRFDRDKGQGIHGRTYNIFLRVIQDEEGIVLINI